MKKQYIGITQRLIEHTEYSELRECLSTQWGEFFMKEPLLRGFLPLPLSHEIDFKIYAPHLSAVILSGGNDLSLLNPNPTSIKRDHYELNIINHAIETQLPLFGVCRGAQHIAAYFQSTLKPIQNHTQEHTIYLNHNKTSYPVNSFHNYGITYLGKDLETLAIAQDQSIESFKHKSLPILACMWHIEREITSNPITQMLMQSFMEHINHHNCNPSSIPPLK